MKEKAVISAVISLMLQELKHVVIRKAIPLQASIEKKMKYLFIELTMAQGILKEAKNQLEDEGVLGWISDLTNVVYDAEDVVDDMVLANVENKGSIWSGGMFKCIITERNKTEEEIASILTRFEGINKKGQFLKLTVDTDWRTLEEFTWQLPIWKWSEQVVGMEDDVEKLLRESILDVQKKELSIAVVEGLDGIGKTTLARKIYNHPDVVARFECYAWVMVSSKFTLERTMKQLIIQLVDYDGRQKILELESEKSTKGNPYVQEKFQEMLHKQLKGKTYFIVLDDVQEVIHWECLKAAFPDEQGRASRLLLTTCNKSIAKLDPRYTHHEMKLQEPEESWKLLAMKAAIIDGGCSEELEPVGRDIAINGLPLTISVAGGLLAGISKKRGWERILNQIRSFRGTDLHKIFELSYENLSQDLKLCLLCLAFFKEGATIPAKTLIHIWVGQGLIEKDGRRTMEEIGRACLDELLYRNMLQIVDLTMEGLVKNCYLHGVLRELFLGGRAKMELRLETVEEAEGMISSKDRLRHLVFYGGNLETSSRSQSKYLHSIFLLNNEGEGVDVDVSSLPTGFWEGSQLLKILYLDDIQISTFPALRALIWLKYLMIRRRKIYSKIVEDYVEPVKLPNWLDGLKYLEILDMEGEKVEFPNEVELKMKRLFYFSAYCVRGPMSINSWANIETLKYIKQEDWIKCHYRQSSSCNVRKLGLFLNPLNSADEWREVRDSLESLKRIEHLQLRWNRFIPFDPQITPKLHTLTKLKLRGKLSKCPDETIFPPNLSHLTLAFSDLSEDLIPQLSKLPKLSYLKLLGNAYKPERMQVLSDGFPCLLVLTLKEMFHLESIYTQQGGMPFLEKLRIQKCPSLQTMKLPEHVVIKRVS